MFAEGSRLVYRLNLAENDGYYYPDALERNAAGVAAGMAEPLRSGEAAADGAFILAERMMHEVVAEYRSKAVGELSRRLNGLAGRDVEVRGDWKSFEASSEIAAGLWWWGLQRVCGKSAGAAAAQGGEQGSAEGGFCASGFAGLRKCRREAGGI